MIKFANSREGIKLALSERSPCFARCSPKLRALQDADPNLEVRYLIEYDAHLFGSKLVLGLRGDDAVIAMRTIYGFAELRPIPAGVVRIP
jgi:hypothetical protein